MFPNKLFGQKQKLLSAAVTVGLTVLYCVTFLAPFAAAAPAPVDPSTSGGTDRLFYSLEGGVAQQAAVFAGLSALSTKESGGCNIKGGLHPPTGASSPGASAAPSDADIGAGKWFGNNATSMGYDVDSTDGQLNCNNENNWFGNILDLAGYAGRYPTAAREVLVTNNTGGINTAASKEKLNSMLATTFFGSVAGKPRSLDYITYYKLLSGFTSANGCNAKPFTNENNAAGKLQATIYVYDTASQSMQRMTYVYPKDKEGSAISIGWDSVGGNDGKLKCSNIATDLNDGQYYNAYGIYAQNHPDDTTLGSAANGGSGGPGSEDTDPCGGIDPAALRWIACPLVEAGRFAVDTLDGAIQQFLYTPTEQVFTDQMKTAWDAFRNIGIALIVVAAMTMLVAQALNLEIFDAYTMRKVLPRIVIAMIGISLSWYLLQYVVTFFNDLGLWANDLILAPFDGVNAANASGSAVLVSWLGIAPGMAYVFSLTPMGTLALLGTLVLFLLMGLLVLTIRQMIILVAVLMAPLAIASYILPGTQKLWGFWKNALTTALVMFPLITGFIAIGKALSSVAASTNSTAFHLLAVLAYFAPYFLLPFTFKLAGGLMSTVFSIANDPARGGFDRLKKFRQGSRAKLHEQRMNQERAPGALGGLYRRFGSAGVPGGGALSFTRRGRASYAELMRKQSEARIAEGLKNDNGRAAGDDLATSLAVQEGMTRNRFLRDYQRSGHSQQEADAALAQIERGFGAQMGSNNMRVAAFKARAASTTAYSGNEAGTQQRINEGASLINAGLLTEADATAAGKGNQGRLDIMGGGFSTQMTAFRNAAASLRNGGPGMTTQQAQDYLDTTLQEADPGYMLAGNTRTIDAMAPAMMRNLERNLTLRADAIARDDQQDIEYFDLQVNRSLGQIAGVQDNLNRTSPQKAGMFADAVNGSLVTSLDGQQITVRQMVENAANRRAGARGFQTFLEVRKEYGTGRAEYASRASAGDDQQPQQPPQP